MALFATLLPYGILSTLLTLAPPAFALFAAAGLIAALMATDRWRGRSLKVLPAATLALTLGLGVCAAMRGDAFTAMAVRLLFDAGLLGVMLASLAVRAPFTIQYAREHVTPDIAARPEFLRANMVMTAVWCAALMLMLAADFGARYLPWLPLWTGLAAAFTLRNGAAWFTRWYGARSQARGEEKARLSSRLLGDPA